MPRKSHHSFNLIMVPGVPYHKKHTLRFWQPLRFNYSIIPDESPIPIPNRLTTHANVPPQLRRLVGHDPRVHHTISVPIQVISSAVVVIGVLEDLRELDELGYCGRTGKTIETKIKINICKETTNKHSISRSRGSLLVGVGGSATRRYYLGLHSMLGLFRWALVSSNSNNSSTSSRNGFVIFDDDEKRCRSR